MSLQTRAIAEREILHLNKRTGIPVKTLLEYAGIPQRTWTEWKERRRAETKHNNNTPRHNCLTPAETRAIAAYCALNPLKGYRVLCYEMIDRNIAFVACSSVYNVIKRSNLGKKWAEAGEMKKKGFDQPARVHEQWHLDISYIRIAGVFYYFTSVLDGYSRRILNWKLCKSMEGINAEILAAEAKELYPEARDVRIITDNGSQFISKDFQELIMLLEFTQTFTSANHPQSNGKLERFHRTLKTEHVRRSAYLDYEDACERMNHWIDYYNNERLHSAIWYLAPNDVFNNRTAARLAERKEKLHTACINRQEYWRGQHAASCHTL